MFNILGKIKTLKAERRFEKHKEIGRISVIEEVAPIIVGNPVITNKTICVIEDKKNNDCYFNNKKLTSEELKQFSKKTLSQNGKPIRICFDRKIIIQDDEYAINNLKKGMVLRITGLGVMEDIDLDLEVLSVCDCYILFSKLRNQKSEISLNNLEIFRITELEELERLNKIKIQEGL